MPVTRRAFTKATLGAGTLLATGSYHAATAESELRLRAIPSSGEKIPVVGVGTNRYGVGDDSELRAPLRDALQVFHKLGGRVIDTAPGYRSSEIVLGELTRELGIVDEMFMATKVDTEGKDESVERMKQSFERLNRSNMDLMQVHNFRGWEDSIPLMMEWKKEGYIRHTGITTSRASQYELMETVMKKYDLDFIQVNYSLANQRESAERLLPLAADRGMAVLVNRPFGGGGVFKALSAASMPQWAQELDIESWGQFLLKYVISHPAVTAAIPGMTKVRHVEDNMGAAMGALPDADGRRQMEEFFDSISA